MSNHLRWRTVFTDTENCDGVAPVCTAAGGADQHTILQDGTRDDTGVYDCCPFPVIETWSEDLAAHIVALLNDHPVVTR